MIALAVSALASGPLFLAGGGSTPPEVVQAFLEEVGPNGMIVVLGQVREEPPRAMVSKELLVESGAKFVVLIDFDNPTPAQRLAAENALANCAGIWVPGGDQNLLMDRWGDEWARRVIGGAVRRGAAYFGTSAGAMLASDWMIGGDGPQIRRGLGLVPFVVDSHVRERNRQPRMRRALEITKTDRALALSEKEWVRVSGEQVEFRAGQPIWVTLT